MIYTRIVSSTYERDILELFLCSIEIFLILLKLHVFDCWEKLTENDRAEILPSSGWVGGNFGIRRNGIDLGVSVSFWVSIFRSI